MQSLNNQRGIALITVLLVMALVAIMAVSMNFGQHIDIRRTSNLLEGDQAMVLALGLEEWGKWVLIRDVSKGKIDHFAENWALGLMPTAVDNGMISGSIVDLQGRINLNNLEENSKMGLLRTKKLVERLFDLCEVESSDALFNALTDWIDDVESITPGGGAEDNEYLLHDPPYLAGNRPLTSPTELLLVEGVTPDNYGCLQDHIAALPTATDINVNTADAMVIASLSDKISLADAAEIVKDRPEKGYATVTDFLAQPAVSTAGVTAEGLSLGSDYFMIQGQALFGEAEIGLYSLVSRVEGVVVYGRSIGTY